MTEQAWLNIFGDNLRDILKEYGYTQKQFADATNIPEYLISLYINKKRMPTIKNLVNMSLELGIDMDEFTVFDDRIY